MNYPKGLTKLEEYVKQTSDDQLLEEFDSYKFQLVENVKREKDSGPTEIIRTDRRRIVAQLDTLTRRLIGKSFVDLCEELGQSTSKFSCLEDFDLNELINHCQCELINRRQGLVGLVVHCTSNYFLQYFPTRLKTDLGRNLEVFSIRACLRSFWEQKVS